MWEEVGRLWNTFFSSTTPAELNTSQVTHTLANSVNCVLMNFNDFFLFFFCRIKVSSHVQESSKEDVESTPVDHFSTQFLVGFIAHAHNFSHVGGRGSAQQHGAVQEQVKKLVCVCVCFQVSIFFPRPLAAGTCWSRSARTPGARGGRHSAGLPLARCCCV